jgi:hypothetical protein
MFWEGIVRKLIISACFYWLKGENSHKIFYHLAEVKEQVGLLDRAELTEQHTRPLLLRGR